MSKTLAQSLARTLGVVSTESVDVDINIGNDAVVDEDGAVISPLAPATDEPIIEAQQTELSEEETGIAETSDDLDDADTDTETLESIQLILEKSMEHGGLDTPSFEMFNITMDHIYRKYGLSAAQVMPSMEAFGEDKLANTQISMEKSMASAKSIAEGAKELIKKLWFQLKKFILNLVKLNFSMKKRIEAVMKKADSMDKTAASKEIKLYSAKHLLIDGKVPAKATIISAYDDAVGGTQKLNTSMSTYVAGSIKFIAVAAQSKGKMEVTTIKPLLDANTNHIASLVTLNKLFPFQNAKFSSVDFGSDGASFNLAGVKFDKAQAPERGADSDAYKVDALSPTEVISICKQLLISVSKLNELNDRYTSKELEKKIVELSDLDESSSDHKKELKQIKRATKALVTTNAKVSSYLSSVNKAMLDYCIQSLNTVDKAPKEAAADKV